jgi:hypothetical protein
MKISSPILIPFILAFVAAAALGSTVSVDLGGLALSVSDSPAAQVFHIVDQLSEWDQYAHKQYVRWSAKSLNLTEEDRELLRKHAELRRARGWGHGFEQAFLVDDSINDAASQAIKAHQLSAAEANAEKDILLHFTPILTGLMEQQHGQIQEFEKQLEKEKSRLTTIVVQLRRFAKSEGATQEPVFLVANPDDKNGGGEANGGRLVIEVPSADPMGFLLHECMHALLAPRMELIKTQARAAEMNWQSLNEGIAYALAPGMTDDIEKQDLLVQELAHYLIRKTPPSDNYAQFYMVAGVIRPMLRAALAKGETIDQFLPKAINEWRHVSGH